MVRDARIRAPHHEDRALILEARTPEQAERWRGRPKLAQVKRRLEG